MNGPPLISVAEPSQPECADAGGSSGPSALDPADLARRARVGAFMLTGRMIALQACMLVGGVSLRRRLAVADFGAIAIAQVAIQFIGYFGDAGLGGALIQKKDEPTQRELSSIFILQIILAAVVVALVWIAAPAMVRFWPDLSAGGVWLFRALSIQLLLTAARVVPTVLMERDLQYGRLSVLEVLIVVPYYATAIALAHLGYGVFSLVAAILAQGALGAVGAFAMRPWRPSPGLDLRALGPVLRFGVAYQSRNVVALLLGAVAPVYAGHVLGQTSLGLIGWAQETASLPLKFVEVISRISFPLYSRLQGNLPLLARSIERSVQLCATMTLFTVGFMFGLGPRVASVIFGPKWLPAVPMLYVYAVGIAFGFLTPLIVPVFDATGRPRLNLKLSLTWTALVVVLVPITTPRWGAVGFAIGYCIPMVLGNLLMMAVLKRIVPDARYWRRLRASVAGAAAIAALGRAWTARWAVSPAPFLAAALLEAAVFAVVVVALDRTLIVDALTMLPLRRAPRTRTAVLDGQAKD